MIFCRRFHFSQSKFLLPFRLSSDSASYLVKLEDSTSSESLSHPVVDRTIEYFFFLAFHRSQVPGFCTHTHYISARLSRLPSMGRWRNKFPETSLLVTENNCGTVSSFLTGATNQSLVIHCTKWTKEIGLNIISFLAQAIPLVDGITESLFWFSLSSLASPCSLYSFALYVRAIKQSTLNSEKKE